MYMFKTLWKITGKKYNKVAAENFLGMTGNFPLNFLVFPSLILLTVNTQSNCSK